MPDHNLIIRVPADLARAVRELLDGRGGPYRSLSEFARVAFENQLALDVAETGSSDRRADERVSEKRRHFEQQPKDSLVDRYLRGPVAAPDPVPELELEHRPLFSLTNRLAPVKTGVRAAILLASQTGEWPFKADFDRTAAEAARRLGIELRSIDDSQGRRAADRRWVGFPVGDDGAAARARFLVSFAFSTDGIPGPLSVLRLATVVDNRVALTRAGIELAISPSPLLAETDGFTLGAEERNVFARQIKSAPAERTAVASFCEAVTRGGGNQGNTDEALQLLNPGWSQKQAVAHRAAMLGRLRDLGLASVDGRGPEAAIQLAPSVVEITRDGG